MRSPGNENAAKRGIVEEKRLIQDIAQGSEHALGEIIALYKQRLYRFILRYVRDDDTAYDLLQECFIRVHNKAASYDNSYAVSTWLFRIAVNLCHDWSRKQKLRNFFSLDALTGDNETNLHDSLSNPLDNPETQAADRQHLSLLQTQIQRLPDKLKAALLLFAIEGHSQEECAAILGVTPKTIELRVYRARKLLLERLPKFL